MEAKDPDDPKGLIREAYRIDGISDGECRSILVDWALSLPPGADQPALAARLVAPPQYPADHPMTVLLKAAATRPAGGPRRRGGRAGRLSS